MMKKIIPQWSSFNGVGTFLASKSDVPLVRVSLSFPVGALEDPVDKQGLTSFVAQMLLRGTRVHSRVELENELDYLGATLSVKIGFHSLSFECEVLTRNLDALFTLILEILTKPSFPELELEKLRNEIIAALHLRLENDANLAKDWFMKKLYGEHPYARDIVGTTVSINKITRDDIAQHFKKCITRDNLLVGGAGNLTQEKLDDITHKLIHQLPNRHTSTLKNYFSRTIQGINVFLIDKPERTQTQFVLGQPGIRSRDEDYFPLTVFMTAFAGHMFQAKYMQEVRVKRGWSYGAYGNLDLRRDGGSIYLYSFPKNSDTVPAIQLSLELLEQASKGESLIDEELLFAKTHLIRSFPFVIDIPEKILSNKMRHRRDGRPNDFLEKFISNVEKVTVSQAREAGKKYLSSKNINIVVLCTAKNFEATIAKELNAKSVEVISYNQM